MITFLHPHRGTNSVEVPSQRVEVTHVPGQALVMYLRHLKLGGMRKHCRIDVKASGDSYFRRVKGAYVPVDGDVVRMRRSSSGV